jgi:hypothetical protein
MPKAIERALATPNTSPRAPRRTPPSNEPPPIPSCAIPRLADPDPMRRPPRSRHH